MTLKKFVLSSVLLAAGLLLHQISPNFIFGMKPDFLLLMMFVCLTFVEDYKFVFVIGVISGILTALTTTFPGGQIPNFIDKIITSQFVYIFMKIFNIKLDKSKGVIITTFLGTLVSGTVFLLLALIMVGLPASFAALYPTVILATCINSVGMVFTLKMLNRAIKYAH
ncbi:tryptophan transporter [Clostridium sp. MSJ-11]|uniref:Tryptophan transporter n=1 Tax=Clostridium mobile TaxID=2841512 RepID=A0ABS6EGN5_9CLOT|nr:tryptophan transporter [Clostridium mobile]MBU5483881.1 tryptophan transporter [Clostridium mobile]